MTTFPAPSASPPSSFPLYELLVGIPPAAMETTFSPGARDILHSLELPQVAYGLYVILAGSDFSESEAYAMPRGPMEARVKCE
jgi:hypothetical protein